MSFRERVYRIVSGIPPGNTLSYSEVALRAGSPRAARAVGNLMSRNPRPGSGPGQIPCHRVVRSDGSPGGYSGPGGAAGKRKLLVKEGTVIRNKKLILSRSRLKPRD